MVSFVFGTALKGEVAVRLLEAADYSRLEATVAVANSGGGTSSVGNTNSVETWVVVGDPETKQRRSADQQFRLCLRKTRLVMRLLLLSKALESTKVRIFGCTMNVKAFAAWT